MVYRILLGIGLVNLAFEHPLLVALCAIGTFLYENTTEEELNMARRTVKETWTSWKRFIIWVKNYAAERNMTVSDVREQMINEAVPEVPQEKVTVNDAIHAVFEEVLYDHQIENLNNNKEFLEKLQSFIINEYQESEVKSAEDGTLNEYVTNCLGEDTVYAEILKDYTEDIDWDEFYTHKIHRAVRKRLLADTRNPDGSIKDEEFASAVEYLVGSLERANTYTEVKNADIKFVDKYRQYKAEKAAV